MGRMALERAESARKGPRAGDSWLAGGDENPTFGGAGSTVGDSRPPRDKTLVQAPPVGPTDGAKGLGTGKISQEGAEIWGFLAGRGWLAIAASGGWRVTEPKRVVQSPNALSGALSGTR